VGLRLKKQDIGSGSSPKILGFWIGFGWEPPNRKKSKNPKNQKPKPKKSKNP
jgi:hypothetical protein